jgi:DNA-binding transcriptional MerR regulator
MQTNKVSHTFMLTIDQVSQLTGVRKSTLRYWEKSFEEFLKPTRTHSNRREYTMDDLDVVQTIKRLLDEEHLTSEGVRVRLEKLLSDDES